MHAEWQKGCRNLEPSEAVTIDSAVPDQSEMHSEQVGPSSRMSSSGLIQDGIPSHRTGEPSGEARSNSRKRKQPDSSYTAGHLNEGQDSNTDTPAASDNKHQHRANPDPEDPGNGNGGISCGHGVARDEEMLEMQYDDCCDANHEVSGGVEFVPKGADAPSKSSKVADTVSPPQPALPAYQLGQKESMKKLPQTPQGESTFTSLLSETALNEVKTMQVSIVHVVYKMFHGIK